jgi:type 1 fimbria pilin
MKFKIKIKLILIVLLYMACQTIYAACAPGTEYANGVMIQSNVTPNITNYNKYEANSYVNVGGIQALNSSDMRYAYIYVGCSGTTRNMKVKTSLSEANRIPSTNIYKLNASSPFAIKLEAGDSPANSTLYEVNNVGQALLGGNGYDGPSSGLRLKFTIYLVDDFKINNSTSNINNLEIARIYLVSHSTSDSPLPNIVTLPIKLSASFKSTEHTCTLSQNSFLVELNDVSISDLKAVGSDATITPKTLGLTINCPYLQNGDNREVKAYITDSINPLNTTDALENKTGPSFATGVGVRLRDKNNTAISLDPNESKSLNKWTFGNLTNTQSINHTIKANYVRLNNRVTAGNVEAKALLNIVYD